MGNLPDTGVLAVVEICDGGRLLEDAEDLLKKVTKAVVDVRKAGDLTLKFKIVPTGRGSIEIRGTVDATIPEHDRNASTFFVDPECNLVRDDPGQQKLPLQQADVPRNPPIRAV